jgi:hypothetical protein
MTHEWADTIFTRSPILGDRGPRRVGRSNARADNGEEGVDFIFRAWNAMVAPRNTPTQIVAKLADAPGKSAR